MLLISLPHHTQICGACENGNWVSLDTFVVCVCAACCGSLNNAASQYVSGYISDAATDILPNGEVVRFGKIKLCKVMQHLCKTYLCSAFIVLSHYV